MEAHMENLRQLFRLKQAGLPEPGKRVVALDVMKGLLIVTMVFFHTYSGFNLHVPGLFEDRWFTHLAIFSGLLFAFGYSTYKAYLEKPVLPRRHIFLNVLRIAAAYVLCAFAYMVFELRILSLNTLLSLIRLDSLIYITEFLLTYAILLILLLLVPQLFRLLPRKDFLFWPVIAGLLLTTFIDYSQVESIYLALFIGSKTVTTYPIVQYLPFYLLGVYFAQRQIRFSWKFLAGAAAALAVFLIARQHGLTNRFPPSFFWMVGSLGAVYLAYLIALFLSRLGFLQRPLADVGRHTLYWLVMSNLIIYSMSTMMKTRSLPLHWVAVILFGSIFYIAFLGSLARK